MASKLLKLCFCCYRCFNFTPSYATHADSDVQTIPRTWCLLSKIRNDTCEWNWIQVKVAKLELLRLKAMLPLMMDRCIHKSSKASTSRWVWGYDSSSLHKNRNKPRSMMVDFRVSQGFIAHSRGTMFWEDEFGFEGTIGKCIYCSCFVVFRF